MSEFYSPRLAPEFDIRSHQEAQLKRQCIGHLDHSQPMVLMKGVG